ncbi:diphosphoinositol polyphosphate phosphohydrolase 2-like [Artemia franciscana]|uniref:diphosphoinositol-polyphosphate diphosphatase n=1 Tax=Artemia franciscana TaxID=6661 RepID=A0AA88HIE4_ARTSF|nr:hypothetical protein QYM36_012856 [Artemia franciscana]KAK2711863.1 hypothetical protein QYM36_012856 [Artemia franciscana]KAK2711864.1 hypothetical protein QYM36_012856 [Artemia franciscana]KAK2711865.1 hypothetical protein QYM36_012856 [Artemia franciscana]KAK2711866.1 hypothetical protein QYM36_012856 [Artemia franciscana]
MVKDKPNSTRIYDEEGYRKRAACICVNGDESEVLLVSSSKEPDRWIVPGGGVEPNEDPKGAAAREVWEEAGVRGQLGRCLGIFENEERRHRTAVYVLLVNEELEEWDDSKNIGRKRKWFRIKDAIELLSETKPLHYVYLQSLLKATSDSDKGRPDTVNSS